MNNKTILCQLCGYYIRSNVYKKHILYCNGLGPRRFREKKILTGKTYEQIYGVQKALQLKEKISNSLTGKPWKCKTQQISNQRSSKIRQKILLRYEAGWLPKAGRCKKIEYESPFAGKIKVDGSWQLAVVKYLDLNNINWKRNTKRFKYFFEDKIRHYTPDFYLVDSNQYLEVKGYKTDKDLAKWNQFTQNLIIYDKSVLKELKIL